MFGLTGSEILGLSVIATLVTTVGNLIATYLREFLFVRSFERWKERRSLLTVYRHYRDPMLLAAQELRSRVMDICTNYPHQLPSVIGARAASQSAQANSADDPYYQRYRLLSTLYRWCAFLGWLELYRQELTFLDTGQKTINDRLEKSLEEIRGDLADGQLNDAPDCSQWSDRVIFREEQRAIGEAMIIGGQTRVVVGYAAFHALAKRADSEDDLWWILVAPGFLLDLEQERAFRQERFSRLGDHLDATISLLASDTQKGRLS